MGEIVALRHNSPAERGGVKVKDIIEEVQVTDAQNHMIQFSVKPQAAGSGNRWKLLDPMRLNFDLNQWAAQMAEPRQVALLVRRGMSKEKLTLDWDDSWRFNNEFPRPPRWSVSLAGLGIAYQVNTV